MPVFSGHYEYVAPGRGIEQQGSARVSFDGETFSLSGPGTPIAFDLGDIDVFEPGDYQLRLVLYDGHVLLLKQFGKSFQDLHRQLLESYRDRLVKCLLVSDLDEVARFGGRVHVESRRRTCDGAAEIRLYESNVAVLPDAAPGFQWRLAEIDAVEFDEREYAVTVRRRGEALVIGRLAKRTGELVERLQDRIGVLRERSARALHALFPFLSPEQFRQLAARMPEGLSAPIKELRPLHRLIEPALLEQTVDGALRPYVAALVGRASSDGWYAGFKIVRKDVEPEADADTEQADAAAESAPGEEAGEEAPPQPADAEAPAAIDLGDGLEALYWFFVPLGGGDHGQASHLAWEASSRGGRATYVFKLPPEGDVRAAIEGVNDGLVALNFRREPVYLPSDRLDTDIRYRHYAIAVRKVPELAFVRQAFAGRALHRSVASWRKQLDAHLAR